MAQSILNNVTAIAASRQLGITAQGMKGTIERLTTGRRINRASDDAAGLGIAVNLNADAKVAHELRKTAFGEFFTAQAYDGYLEEATSLVLRNMELAAGGNGATAEMTSVSGLAVAAAAKANGTAIDPITDMATASTALTAIQTARAAFAADMAESLSNANLYGIEEENKIASMSNIMDADIGAEVVQLTKWQILSQAGVSALGQANQASQTVLGLLR